MNRDLLLSCLHKRMEQANEGVDSRVLVDALLEELLLLSRADCGVFLRRETADPFRLLLNTVRGDKTLLNLLDQPLSLPDEYAELEEGGSALSGPQPGSILLDDRYQYGLLLPLGAAGCVVLMALEDLPQVDVEGLKVTLESLGQLLLLVAQLDGAKAVSSSMGNRRLDEEISQADRENAAKSEFVTRMSHELRTPLNAILGFTQLFDFDDNLTELQQDNIKEIERAGYLMLDMVGEVLDLAKIESGRIEISMEGVLLAGVLEECISLVSRQAAQRDIIITLSPDTRTQFLRADQTRLKQVLINLLSNAVKYNREAGVINVSCCTVDNGMCRISVTDSGTGIDESKITSLFQAFNRLGVDSAGIEGSGMGLVISKKLVELMGGTIGVKSVLGEGTTFWFELLADELPESADMMAMRLLSDSVSVNDLRILVVEDNLVNQDLLRQQLHLLGYSADVVANGQSAIDSWRDGDYNCILTDCNMPIMDGYAMAQAIRQEEQSSDSRVPIIAITANAGELELQRCRAAGMDILLSKPLDINRLSEVLASLSGEEHAELMPDLQNTTTQEAEVLPIDTQFLARLVGDNRDLQRRVLLKFLEITPATIDEINIAIDDKDSKQLQFVAHRLKSSARSMGGNALGDCCEQLEESAKSQSWENIAILRETLITQWKLLNDSLSDMDLLTEST